MYIYLNTCIINNYDHIEYIKEISELSDNKFDFRSNPDIYTDILDEIESDFHFYIENHIYPEDIIHNLCRNFFPSIDYKAYNKKDILSLFFLIGVNVYSKVFRHNNFVRHIGCSNTTSYDKQRNILFLSDQIVNSVMEEDIHFGEQCTDTYTFLWETIFHTYKYYICSDSQRYRIENNHEIVPIIMNEYLDRSIETEDIISLPQLLELIRTTYIPNNIKKKLKQYIEMNL